MAQRSIVLAISPDNAEALLEGRRRFDHRAIRPKGLPARAYLAVSGTASIVGECTLGEPVRRTDKGWAIPVSGPRRYRTPRPLSEFGLAKVPRSFRYVGEG
jgi:predicted transcriptional regulator